MELRSNPDSANSIECVSDARSTWEPALRDCFDDAERALEALIELGMRAMNGDSSSLLALGSALSLVVDRVEAHHQATEAGAAHDPRRPGSVVSAHIAYFRALQRQNLDNLTQVLRDASDTASLAQAVVVTGMVLLQDWVAHGRLLAALAEPPASTFS